MADMSMKFKLFGTDVSASKSLEKVGREAGKTGGAFKHMGATAAGVFGGLAIGSLVSKVAAFGKESVDAFANAARETKTLQRYLGGTAEEASKLRAAAHMTGVSTEDLARGLGKMSRFAYAGAIQLGQFNDKAAAAAAKHKPFHAALGKNAQMLKQLGVDTINADGSMRSTNSVLMDLADRFKAMPNGIEKTNAVMSIFGKSGMQLLPFLNKGSEGLKEFGIEAEKTGNVLSEKDLKATTEATMAKRHLHEAVEGLQISIGRNLYPAFTKVTLFMSQHVVPVVKSVLDFMSRNKDIVGPLAVAVGVLSGSLFTFVKVMQIVTAVTKAWTAVQKILDAELTLNPIGLVIVAIVALVAAIVIAYKKSETFRKIVQGALHGVAAAFGFLKDAAEAVFNWLKPAFEFIGKLFIGYINGWINGINAIFTLLNKIPHIKAFGHEVGFNLSMIPLLGQPGFASQSSMDTQRTHHDFGLARSSGVTVNVNVAGSVTAERDLARTVRDHIAQGIRRRGLSPSALGV